MFTACDKDDDDDPVTPADLSPTIGFNTAGGYTSADATLQPNEDFLVGIVAGQNPTSTKKLQELYISRTSSNNITWDTTLAFNDETINLDVTFTALAIETDEVILFRVKDKNNETASKSLNIKTEQLGGAILEYTQKILGSHQSATGSSFASITGTVYNMTDAKTHADEVDFLYYYGTNNAATIAAPDDADAATVFDNPAVGLQTWSVLNSTRFATTNMTPTDFDGILNDLAIVAAAQTADKTTVINLDVNDVIAFKTDAGKMGLIKVVSIDGLAADGTITLDIKVQE